MTHLAGRSLNIQLTFIQFTVDPLKKLVYIQIMWFLRFVEDFTPPCFTA